MKLGYKLRLSLVVANALFVLMTIVHVPLTLWVAVFTAQYLFVYYVTNIHKILGYVGAMSNYMGVVVGGIAKVDAVLVMALFGSIFMLCEVIENRKD